MGGGVAPSPRCAACIFKTYLILFQTEGKKNTKEKVPEALKGFHCSEHLGGWLSGEGGGTQGLRVTGGIFHHGLFP